MRERDLVRLIDRAASSGDWRAAAWLLERRYPERYARRPPAREEETAAGPDSLDELAGRRQERREGLPS